MRITHTALALALPLLAACGSTPKATSQSAPVAPATAPGAETIEGTGTDSTAGGPAGVAATAEEPVDRFAPIPAPEWTGAFRERSVLLARTIRVEGPAPLLSHMVASSDDDLFERSVQTTPDGLLQVVTRASDEVQVVRGHLDAWRLAAEQKIVILERVTPGPVVVIADGEVMWRDRNGAVERADRLEFVGEIGNMEPARPGDASAATGQDTDEAQDDGAPAPVDEDGGSDDGAPAGDRP